MIRSFGDDTTKAIWQGYKQKKLPPDIVKRAFRRLEYIDAAKVVFDLNIPPSNCLEALVGNLKGFWSIRINDKYRIIFKFENSDAHEVEITNHYK